MASDKMTTCLIVGNRGFFPDHLAKSGREEMLKVLSSAGMDVVALSPEESKCRYLRWDMYWHECPGGAC